MFNDSNTVTKYISTENTLYSVRARYTAYHCQERLGGEIVKAIKMLNVF